MSPLESFLAAEIEGGSFPGAVALVGGADRVTEVAAAGHACVDPRTVPAVLDTAYDLASLTKPLAVGALVAELGAELDLGSAPGRYLPAWKATRYDGITIGSILTHTSGLPAWRPVYAGGEGAAAYRKTLAAIEPEARPGERVIYSDLNFLLLGDVLEIHASAPLDAVFDAIVAGPSGSGARFLPAGADARGSADRGGIATEPRGGFAATERGDATERRMAAELGISYPRFRDGVVWGEVHDGNACRRGGVAGNAGLFGTARDVWSLARGWLDPARAPLVRDRTPDLSESRGIAWQGTRGAGSAVPSMPASAFGHTGFTGTSVWIDPEAGRIAILLANRIHPVARDVDFNAVRRRFHEVVWGEAARAPERPGPPETNRIRMV